MLITLEQVGRF